MVTRAERRSTSALVGRTEELALIEERLTQSEESLKGITIEGEPGIGKSSLLMTTAELARERGYAAVMVTADEEIRGPFLVARGIFGSDELREGLDSDAKTRLDAVCDLMAGRSDPEVSGLSPEMRVLRIYDQAALALRAAAANRPVALLLDDVQWADDDSLRVLRYICRTERRLHAFVALAIRPEESATATELTNLLADLERADVIRRIRVARFRQPETAELLRRRLGGDLEASAAAAIHRQAEGVPFIVEELARTYRDAGLLQFVDDSWRLARKAGTLMPSAVRTLIQRRAARLPADAREVLADAAILGRTFRIADLCALRSKLGSSCDPSQLAEAIAPAVAAGLISDSASGASSERRFAHEQVREYLAGLLSAPRRREVNAAIVDMLAASPEMTPATLTVLAKHALEAGNAERSTRFSIEAARASVDAGAPEEALRVIEDGLAQATGHKDRITLLQLRDDALQMVRRPDERLEGIAELSALAELAGDPAVQSDVMLRRASALRGDEQYDAAATLARRARALAVARADGATELAACMELGQDLLRAAMGEGYVVTPLEADLDGAEEAYGRGVELAESLDDKRRLAYALREAAIVDMSRVRVWFVDAYKDGKTGPILEQVANGTPLQEILVQLPIMQPYMAAEARLRRALDLFRGLGDRRGQMSCLIAFAYLNWGAQVHIGSNPAQRIEEIRRLAGRLDDLTQESDRAATEAQMLYAVHVFARSKLVPDLALSRGKEAWQAARAIGERTIEFQAAGSTAMMCADIGDLDAMDEWLRRAADVASHAPTSHRGWQLETWQLAAAAARNDPEGLRSHFERALRQVNDHARAAARAETMAIFALEAARLGAADLSDAAGARTSSELLDAAETAANEGLRLSELLPGHAPWPAQALAALARVRRTRGDMPGALEAARKAFGYRTEALREDPHAEIQVAAAETILEGGDAEEQEEVRTALRLIVTLTAQRTQDPEVRARWLSGPVVASITELIGGVDVAAAPEAPAGAITDDQRRLLQLLSEGRSDREIADSLGLSDAGLAAAMATTYATIGVGNAADASALAYQQIL